MNEESLFIEALEVRDPAERAAFLDTACAGDAATRDRLQRLLEQHERAGDFLIKPAPQRLAEGQAADADAPNQTRTGPSSADGDEGLDFLTPSEQPDSLGRLGHYDVLEVIGRGGMGIVLRAFDAKLHRVVAIKVMAAQLATNATARRRFIREAQAQAAVSHDHVVTIHAVEEANGRPYLVMQYVAGVSLQERLERGGSLQIHEILRIGMQTAAGLAAAHAQGLIHRDVKPANILLENGVERVKITDFGLARAATDASLTQSGVVAGTPHYMSPEQAQGAAVDQRSDLFSLGSVLYAMGTGRAPFRASGTMAVLKRVCEQTPSPIRDANPEILDWLAALIEKLHAKAPADRYQSAAEVADLLGRHLAHVQHPSVMPLPAAIPPASGGREPPVSAERSGGARPALAHRRRWAMAAALLLVLIGGLSMTEATGVTNLRATVIRIATGDGTLIVEVNDPDVKVTIDGDGGLVITGAGPHEVRLRPGSYKLQAAKDGKPVRLDRELVTITRGDKQVVRVAMELKDKNAGNGGAATGLDFKVGEVRKHFWVGRRVYFAGFSPDGRYYVATGEANGPGPETVRVWELANGKLLLEVTGNEFALFTPDSKRLIAAGPDRQIHVWDLAARKQIAQFGEHPVEVRLSSLSADGKQLLTGCLDGVVRLWDVAEGKEIARLESDDKLGFPYFCPDGKQVITLDYPAGIIRLWDLAQRKEIRRWQQPDTVTGWLAFLPGGQRFVTSGPDAVYFWDMAAEKEMQSLRLVGKMAGIAFSPDGSRLLYTVRNDPVMRLVELPGGKELATFEMMSNASDWLLGTAFSPDGQFAVAAYRAGVVQLWRLPDPPALGKK
jgi:WD40 repeat protein